MLFVFRFENILHYKAKSVLIQSFIYANFNYCPLVWHFSNAKSLLKVEMIQKRCLRFLSKRKEGLNSYEDLLNATNRSPMSVNRLRTLCIEIFKTINNLNPSFMKNIFEVRNSNRPVRTITTNNSEIKPRKTITFGTNSLSALGPRIWNSLPSHLKCSESLSTFKQMINRWDGSKCSCDDCHKILIKNFISRNVLFTNFRFSVVHAASRTLISILVYNICTWCGVYITETIFLQLFDKFLLSRYK